MLCGSGEERDSGLLHPLDRQYFGTGQRLPCGCPVLSRSSCALALGVLVASASALPAWQRAPSFSPFVFAGYPWFVFLRNSQ